MIVMLVLITGCSSVRYSNEGGSEQMSVNTLFKSLDGLYAERDGFTIGIDATHTQDPVGNMLELMKLMQAMQVQPIAGSEDN
jgi:hypothetical protein